MSIRSGAVKHISLSKLSNCRGTLLYTTTKEDFLARIRSNDNMVTGGRSSSLKTLSTLARYGLVGAVNTSATIATMAGLAYLGIHYTVYTAVGYILGFVISYILNGVFTFRCTQLSHRAFLRFAGINSSLLIFVEILQIFLIERLAVPELPGVATGMVVYTLSGFFLNRRFVYQQG